MYVQLLHPPIHLTPKSSKSKEKQTIAHIRFSHSLSHTHCCLYSSMVHGPAASTSVYPIWSWIRWLVWMLRELLNARLTEEEEEEVVVVVVVAVAAVAAVDMETSVVVVAVDIEEAGDEEVIISNHVEQEPNKRHTRAIKIT